MGFFGVVNPSSNFFETEPAAYRIYPVQPKIAQIDDWPGVTVSLADIMKLQLSGRYCKYNESSGEKR